MTNNLFDEPKKPDEFKTESPLRAFASFDMKGLYLIAKGFRPSLGHLTNYLDAMEKKEGWQLVQILEASTGVPTMVFRQAKGDLLEQFQGSELLIEALREQLNKGHTRLHTWSIHAAHPDAPGYIDAEKEKEAREHVSRLGLTLGGEEVHPHPLEAPYGATMTIKGLDPEKIIWNRVQWRGEIEKLFEAARERPNHVKVKDFLRREQVVDISHYYRTASVGSVLRLIDMFEGWDTYALDEYISDDALFTAIGWTNPKAREACNTDSYAAVAAAIRETEVTSEPITPAMPANPVDVLESMAEDIADDLGLDVDRESFAVARAHVEEMVPALPEDVPNELREKAAEFVFERIGVHPKHRYNKLREFKKTFLNPKGTPVSHKRFDEQLQFILGDSASIVPIREAIESWKRLQPLYEKQPDDPLNPHHYNGRECADIGERLSANGYQILKYCWRLGKKDDPCQELGKALWYLESEIALLSMKGHPNDRMSNRRGLKGDTDQWVYGRLNGQSEFTRKVALFLWDGYNIQSIGKLKAMIADHKATLDCGHGLAI